MGLMGSRKSIRMRGSLTPQSSNPLHTGNVNGRAACSGQPVSSLQKAPKVDDVSLLSCMAVFHCAPLTCRLFSAAPCDSNKCTVGPT